MLTFEEILDLRKWNWDRLEVTIDDGFEVSMFNGAYGLEDYVDIMDSIDRDAEWFGMMENLLAELADRIYDMFEAQRDSWDAESHAAMSDLEFEHLDRIFGDEPF